MAKHTPQYIVNHADKYTAEEVELAEKALAEGDTTEEEVVDGVVNESECCCVEPIARFDADFNTESLNLMRDKINEIIERINR